MLSMNNFQAEHFRLKSSYVILKNTLGKTSYFTMAAQSETVVIMWIYLFGCNEKDIMFYSQGTHADVPCIHNRKLDYI